MRANKREESATPVYVIWMAAFVACLWAILALAHSSRDYYLVNYGSMRSIDAWLEPFGASGLAMLFVMVTMGLWLWVVFRVGALDERALLRSIVSMAIGLLGIVPWGMSWSGESVSNESIWPTYWLSGWTGLGFSFAVSAWSSMPEFGDNETRKETPHRDIRLGWLGLILLGVFCGVWWTMQSFEYYDSFMLGFNDFGHFMQRVANTAEGRGVLLETPVLPMFWDHFNPGLLLLVPLWKLFPDVTLCFYLQSAALTLSGLGVWKIARNFGHSESAAALWCMAWWMQPVLGQMNLAYSYGWHPISFAIPLMLLSMLSIQSRKYGWALVAIVLALSMEEGVFVATALFCAVQAFLRLRWIAKADELNAIASSMTWQAWAACALISGVGFVIVFRWSGLAEFQTARFASLGSSPLQVVASPVLRPYAFWGQLFRPQSAYFVFGLMLPLFLPSLIRGWHHVVAIALPLGVLLVWEHRPAQSLAFQYSSTLLPILWFASMAGASVTAASARPTVARWFSWRFSPLSSAAGALATSATMSLFIGQMPFSARTLTDVQARTYEPTEHGIRLVPGTDENVFLQEQLQAIRQDRGEVLATGRIASHCVGNRDVETVGQYVQRRDKLAKLADRLDAPMRHYQWVILDRQEGFQQTRDEIQAVEREVNASGFRKIQERFGIVLYRNDGLIQSTSAANASKGPEFTTRHDGLSGD